MSTVFKRIPIGGSAAVFKVDVLFGKLGKVGIVVIPEPYPTLPVLDVRYLGQNGGYPKMLDFNGHSTLFWQIGVR